MQLDQSALPLILSIITTAAAAIATFVNLRIKADVQNVRMEVEKANSALENRIAERLEKFRGEFSSGFLTERVAMEQRSSVMYRVENLEAEVKSNRGRIHDISGEIMTNIVAEIFKLNTALTEKARRLGSIEARMDALDRTAGELADRVHDIEVKS